MPTIESGFTLLLLTTDQNESACQQLINDTQTVFPMAQIDLINFTKAKPPKETKVTGIWISKKTFGFFGQLPSHLLHELKEKPCDLLLFTGEKTDVFTRYLALAIDAQLRASFAKGDDLVFQLQLHADAHLPMHERLQQLAQYLKLLKGKS